MTNTKKGNEYLVVAILAIVSLVFVIPILIVISVSFSNDKQIMISGYSIIPKQVDLTAYKLLFKDIATILNAYKVTIIVSVVGASTSVLLTAMLAYTMSRQDYAYAKITTFFVFFTMLFTASLIPWYIMNVNYLKLKDTIFALILPYVIVPWNVMLMKGFLQDISPTILESAKIDGAGEFRIFFQIVIPLSKAGLATVGLFMLLQYWNDYYLSLMFIERSKVVSLQFLLYRTMSNIDFLRKSVLSQSMAGSVASEFPSLSSRMAMCVIAAGPMLVIFPFFQKYFVKGITVGSVKG